MPRRVPGLPPVHEIPADCALRRNRTARDGMSVAGLVVTARDQFRDHDPSSVALGSRPSFRSYGAFAARSHAGPIGSSRAVVIVDGDRGATDLPRAPGASLTGAMTAQSSLFGRTTVTRRSSSAARGLRRVTAGEAPPATAGNARRVGGAPPLAALQVSVEARTAGREATHRPCDAPRRRRHGLALATRRGHTRHGGGAPSHAA
jgi:hypothetical protein